jgi:hypothetical protein
MIKIKIVKLDEFIPVYDIINVDQNSNFFGNNTLIHNCFEIGMTPILDYETEVTGFQFCNLSEINAKACMKNGKLDKEKFYEACKAAAILGTLQAGYVSFPYLGSVTEEITIRESLIGVSVTGWMDNPELFDEETLKEGVRIINDTNEEIAKLIGINPAARTTAVKPSGNACTKIETKIRTENGIMTMEEIFNYISNGDLGIHSMPEKTYIVPENSLKIYDENNELKDLVSFYINGFEETYDITFEVGYIYSFTENHKLKTEDGWKFVKDLNEDDIIISFE